MLLQQTRKLFHTGECDEKRHSTWVLSRKKINVWMNETDKSATESTRGQTQRRMKLKVETERPVGIKRVPHKHTLWRLICRVTVDCDTPNVACCSYAIKRRWRKKYRKPPDRMLSQPISLLVFEIWDVCTSGPVRATTIHGYPSCLIQSRLTEMNLHRSVVVSGAVPDPGSQGATQHLPSFTVTFNQHFSVVKHGEVTLVNCQREILIIHRDKTSVLHLQMISEAKEEGC